MAIALVQQHAVSVVSGDHLDSDGKPGYQAWIAWPTTPTVGNRCILWGSPIDDATYQWQTDGWTEIGSRLAFGSPFDTYGLRVWTKVFAAGDATLFDLSADQGQRYSAGLMEFSGVASVSATSPTLITPSASIPSYTLGPSLSITALATSDLLIWIGHTGGVPDDGTQELVGVTYTGGVMGLHISPNMGERLSSGDVIGTVGWAGTLASPSVAAHASAPTWVWYGGGTTKPNLTCLQRGIRLVAS
jgi:hypothetical protein